MEEVERRQRQDQQNLFMRVKVAIPISKPLPLGGYLAGSDGEKVWTTFKYERLPMFCHHSGLLGNDIKHCVKYFALTKNGKEASLQYGEWLKASRGWMWSSSVKKPRNDTVDDEGSAKYNGQGKAAADSHDYENPSEQEGNEQGKNGKSGNIQEAGVNGVEISAHVVTDMDWLSSSCKGNISLWCSPKPNRNNEELMPHEKSNVMHEEWNESHEERNVMNEERKGVHEEQHVMHRESEHAVEKVSDGPKVTKLKSTWTRLARVSEENKKSGPIKPNTILGKRGVQHTEVDSETDSGGQMSKREKLQEDVHNCKAVGVQDHPGTDPGF